MIFRALLDSCGMTGVVFLISFLGCTKTSAREVLPFPLVNETTSLVIEDSSWDGSEVHLFIRNEGKFPVVSFVITIGELSVMSEFMPPASSGVTPGGNYDLNITPLKLGSTGTRSGDSLTLRAALFADGSAEGDKVAVASMRAARLGQIAQIQRIVQVLRATLTASDNQLVSALGSAIHSISVLPETLSDGSVLTADGIASPLARVRTARENITDELRQLQEVSRSIPPQDLRSRILRILNTHIASLTALQNEHARP